MLYVTVNGRKIHKGMTVTAHMNQSVCPAGTVAEIFALSENKGNLSPAIGLYSKKKVPGWSDLNGTVEYGHGWWLSRSTLARAFIIGQPIFVIKDDIQYKGKKLQGMKCEKIPSSVGKDTAFVQLEKNVGGGSADGLGKAGHCIVVNPKALEMLKESKGKEK
jgi:hypothetical protein